LNHWRAGDPSGHPIKGGALVPESFGFVHGGRLQPGLGEWLSTSGQRGTVTFRTEIAVKKPMVLTLQVVGRPVKLPPGATVSHVKGDMKWPCHGEAAAARVRVALRPARGKRRIEVRVRPAAHCAPRVHGLAIRLERDGDGKYTEFGWRPVKRAKPGGSFVLRTADGVPLTDLNGSGRPTEAAYLYNLVPIVGFGTADTFSLAGMLARTPLPSTGLDVRLTIDARVQTATQEALTWGLKRFPKAGRFVNERKGAVVVMNADTGAILAAASYPTLLPGSLPWDYASFATTYPLRDPSAVLGWEVIDRNNTPGSTFKPLVSLALMRAPRHLLSRIAPIMRGLDASGMAARIGIRPGQSRYSPSGSGARGIDNFGGANIGRYFGRRRRDHVGCKVPPAVDPGFGVRQAVQFSVNIWFARMAVVLDGPTIDAFVAKLGKGRPGQMVRPPATRLMETIRWLGIDDRKRLDLASNVPAEAHLFRYSGEGGADILYAQLPKNALLDMELPADKPRGIRNLLRWVIALNGIGQSVSVSPLHMAVAVSAVASGRRPRPHLISSWGGRRLDPPPTRPLNVDPALLTLLRQGMKAVPEVGTAAGAFRASRHFRCRVHGKTGTAEIDKGKAFNSAWFIGWIEPKSPGQRRLAWACMITHARGGLRFGGTACAPVINRMLKALEGPAIGGN
ncbi:MAG: penicillin-binding transpeptidase domain-containing protein, partial [Alphaproteobacteria bacterium]